MIKATFVGLALCVYFVQPMTAGLPVKIAGRAPEDWPSGDGGLATKAMLQPGSLARDANGDLLIADIRTNRIRRVTSNGLITTMFDGGSAVDIRQTFSMTVDGSGTLYLSGESGQRVYRIAPNGTWSEIRRPGNRVIALLADAAGNLFLTDADGFIWRRTPDGNVAKIAGDGNVRLQNPAALAFDRFGNLLIGDYQGLVRLSADGSLVRLSNSPVLRLAAGRDGKIYYFAEKTISVFDGVRTATYAGTARTGFSDGCAYSGGVRDAKNASLSPQDMVIDAQDRLFVADSSGRVRRIDPDGSIRTVAGSGDRPRDSGFGERAIDGYLGKPDSIAVDQAGGVFFAEPAVNRVFEILPGGELIVAAGSQSAPIGEDPACYAPDGPDVLSQPGGVAVDGKGNLYISDTGNRRILRRSPTGEISILADSGLHEPRSIAVDSHGIIFVVDGATLLRIDNGDTRTLPSPATALAVAIDADGRLLVSTPQGLYKQSDEGAFFRQGSTKDRSLSLDQAGNIYTPTSKITTRCNFSQLHDALYRYALPVQIASDKAGNVYFTSDASVWRVPATISSAPEPFHPRMSDPGIFNAASGFAKSQLHLLPIGGPYFVYSNDSITGGEVVRIVGDCLGQGDPVAAGRNQSRLPSSLGGTRVLFDGIETALVLVAPGEVVAVAPQVLSSRSKTLLVVESQGVRTGAVAVDVEPVVPGIYVTNGTQAVAVSVEDGSVNGPEHPAPIGSLLSIFLTGVGPWEPVVEDGIVAIDPLPQVKLPVTASIGGVRAEVPYAAAAPGLVGVAEVTLRVPPVEPGDALVTVSVGGVSRPQRVRIAVR